MSAGASIDVFYDERVLDHDTGHGHFEAADAGLLDVPELHPENAERIRNMRSVLARGPLAARLRWHPGRLAGEDELATVHDPAYVDSVREACAAGGRRLTATTVVGAGSWEPIRAAAGTCLAAGEAVLDGRAQTAYALVRPPGHHAQPAQADGYCLFNHAALVAELARRRGLERVAVVDWDVHHGNGTQACFWDRGDVLTVSLHMRTGVWGTSHQQSGAPGEIGVGAGLGRNLNLDLSLGAGDRAYAEALRRVVVPVLRGFRPQLLIAGCGQDASAFDPNGRHNVSMAGFRRIGRIVGDAARELCEGRLVLLQEGGYARTYAAMCLHATLEGVLGAREPMLPETLAYVPDEVGLGRPAVEAAQGALSHHWRFDDEEATCHSPAP